MGEFCGTGFAAEVLHSHQVTLDTLAHPHLWTRALAPATQHGGEQEQERFFKPGGTGADAPLRTASACERTHGAR